MKNLLIILTKWLNRALGHRCYLGVPVVVNGQLVRICYECSRQHPMSVELRPSAMAESRKATEGL